VHVSRSHRAGARREAYQRRDRLRRCDEVAQRSRRGGVRWICDDEHCCSDRVRRLLVRRRPGHAVAPDDRGVLRRARDDLARERGDLKVAPPEGNDALRRVVLVDESFDTRWCGLERDAAVDDAAAEWKGTAMMIVVSEMNEKK